MASLFRPLHWTVLAAALLPVFAAAQTARVGAPAPDLCHRFSWPNRISYAISREVRGT